MDIDLRDNLDILVDEVGDMIDFYRQHPVIAASDLLNVDLAPIQRIVLKDMWFKNYTISVCGRGFGKTYLLGVNAALHALLYPGYRVGLIAPSFRQCFCNDISNLHTFWTSDGLKTGQDFFNSIVDGHTGVQSLYSYNTVLNKWENSIRDGVEITTEKGLEVGGTLDHKILVLQDDASLSYSELCNLDYNSNIVIRKGFNYFGNNNKLPLFEFNHDWRTKDCIIPEELTPELSYLFGLITGDGCVSVDKTGRKNRVMFTSGDEELIDKFKELMLKYFNLKHTDENGKNRAPQVGYYCKKLVEFLLLCGFTKTNALDKKIPDVIKKSSKECFISFVRGLMDTDGCCYVQTHKHGYSHCEIALNTSSKQLAKEVQSLFLNLGIMSNLAISSKAGRKKLMGRDVESVCSDAYKVRITGVENIINYNDVISFGLNRKKELLDVYINSNPNQVSTTMYGTKDVCMKIIGVIKPCLKRGSDDNKVIGKIKNRLKNSKHSGVTRDVIHTILDMAIRYNVLLDICDNLKHLMEIDCVVVRPIEFKYIKTETFDIEVENEHCYWANGFINHNSKMIFAEVEKIYQRSHILREAAEKKPTRGADTCFLKLKHTEHTNGSFIEALPIGVDGAKIRGSRFYLIEIDELAQMPPQVIDMVIRPMAAVSLEPMKKVREIERIEKLIEQGLATQDDLDNAMSVANKMAMTTSGYFKFNHTWNRMKKYWKAIADGDGDKYAVHQVPYQLLPKGFLDMENIKEAERTMSRIEFIMEYEAAMVSDSEGFFKASLLEACSNNTDFSVMLAGDKGKEYVMGVDPNQGGDAKNAMCGIVIFELGNPNKLVYAEGISNNKTQDIVVKIQQLSKVFNIVRIYMDSQGGGKPVRDLLQEGYNEETPILDIEDINNYDKFGRRILLLVNPSTQWISDANFDALAMLEQQNILFPSTPLTKSVDEEYREDIYEYIKMLKSQMLNIVLTETGRGVRHFDTPKKGQNKDLYSAFILAAWGTRELARTPDDQDTVLQTRGLIRAHQPGSKFLISQLTPQSHFSAAVLTKRIKK